MNTKQPTLFDLPPQAYARRHDPHTSHVAAKVVTPNLSALKERVMTEMRIAGPQGLTDIELEELCGSHGSTFRTRRSELVAEGLIVKTDRLRELKGSKRIVWMDARFK